MPATEPRRRPRELARLGSEVFERRVRPMLRPEDDGKFIAVDIQTGEYELDEDDYAAVSRLRGRIPARPGLAQYGRVAGGVPDEAGSVLGSVPENAQQIGRYVWKRTGCFALSGRE
jgi:hypothetical protein